MVVVVAAAYQIKFEPSIAIFFYVKDNFSSAFFMSQFQESLMNVGGIFRAFILEDESNQNLLVLIGFQNSLDRGRIFHSEMTQRNHQYFKVYHLLLQVGGHRLIGIDCTSFHFE